MLDGVPAADLAQLRTQIAEYLFQADRRHFAKVAQLSSRIPVAIAARVTEFALPPLLAARTAELLEPKRGLDLIARLSDRYLADVAAAMDPGRSPELIARLPAERVATIGAELARRGEWVVIGGFVSQVSRAALRAAVGVLDGEQLLRVGYVLDEGDRLDQVAAVLSDSQLDAMLAAAPGLWTELDVALVSVAAARGLRWRSRLAASPPEVRASVAEAAARGQLSAAASSVLGLA
jgi:hypothetical protein